MFSFVAVALMSVFQGCPCCDGGPCTCGPDCACAQFVDVAQDRKEAIKAADKADCDSWKGWVRHSDGWWYNHNQPVNAVEPTRGIFRNREGGGRMRGGRRGGCSS